MDAKFNCYTAYDSVVSEATLIKALLYKCKHFTRAFLIFFMLKRTVQLQDIVVNKCKIEKHRTELCKFFLNI